MIRLSALHLRLLSSAMAIAVALPPVPVLAQPRVEIAQAAGIKSDAERGGRIGVASPFVHDLHVDDLRYLIEAIDNAAVPVVISRDPVHAGEQPAK